MNYKSLFSILPFILFISICLFSCKRSDPVLEDDQEEYDAVEILFTELNNPSKTVKVIFNRFGSPEKTQYVLNKNQKYRMDLTMIHNEESINEEIEEESDAHQFFFFAPENSVLDYQYLDDQLGLTGTISFGENQEEFKIKVLLRHGLNKDHPEAKVWNSVNYVEAGGVDDLMVLIPLVLR